VPNYEIARRLQEQGISPMEINDALGKAQIKSAVADTGSTDGMQPSILGSEEEQERLPLEGLEGTFPSDEELTPPRPGGYQMQGMIPLHVTKEVSGAEMPEEYAPQEDSPQEVYTPRPQLPSQESYEYQQYQPSFAGAGSSFADTDTVIEVAEQVFLEKNKPLQKKIDDFSEFRALAQTRIDNISDRVRRMESIIDRLQSAILEKIGSYGSGLEIVRKEMNMMQESFGKVLNKVADSSERHVVHHHAQPQHAEKHVTVHRSTKRTTQEPLANGQTTNIQNTSQDNLLF
jgi:hypothetical protein